MKKIFTIIWVSLAILFVWQAHGLSQTPSGSDFYYMWDTKQCEVIDYMCEEGWSAFSDNSGCGCKKENDPDIVLCTMEYAPVCGQPVFDCPDGAICMMPQPVTYSNKCQMNAAGAKFLYEGQCDHDKPTPEPKACPENWDPVCGKTQAKACLSLDCAQRLQTYSNMCFLEIDNAEFQYEWKCEEEKKLPEPTKTKYYVGDSQECTMIKYRCEEDWDYFRDDIGCGCEKKIDEDTLSNALKQKINEIVEKFIKKLEAKDYTNEEKWDVITIIILKIELLKAEKPQYKSILDYTIIVLNEYFQRYKEDDLGIIKKIFQDF